MSQIIIKTTPKDLVFDEWKTFDPTFMWSRALLHPNAYETEYDEGVGITIQCFHQQWVVRFYNPRHFYVVKESYYVMCPNAASDHSFATADEAKMHIDKFLHRVNTMKAFI